MNGKKIHELIESIARCTSTPGAGVTRPSYSPEDRRARDIVVRELRAAGCEPWTDWIGNLHAVLPGRDRELPAVMVGSHLDSVPNGGRFDGVVGVVGGLATLARLREAGVVPERSVRFVVFAEEEGGNFNFPLLGSKVFTGAIGRGDLEGLAGADGVRALERIDAAVPRPSSGAAPDAGVWRMVELHVEQGGTLHENGAAIGVVDCIAADAVLTVRVAGRSGHSGACPMKGRKDALAAAAAMILSCESLANSPEGEGTVLTVGSIDCRPNAFNCIPDAVTFTVDARNPDPDRLRTVRGRVERLIREHSAARGVEAEISGIFTEGVEMSPDVGAATARAAESRGYSWRAATSWAMHDAGAVARISGTGMIFIPSVDGVSHNPGEYTPPEDIERGIDVLHAVIAELAG